MARPILRLATRVNRRTRWTAWAIACACMVLVGSLSLVDGLSAGVNSVTSRFPSGPTLYLRGTDLLASAVDENTLVAIPTDYTVLRAHVGTIALGNVTRPVVVASLTVYHAGNATTPFPADSQNVSIDAGLAAELAAAGLSSLPSAANVTLFGRPAETLSVAPPPSARPDLFPDTWAWVRPELLIAMSPSEGGSAQALITPSPLDARLASSLGLTPLPTVGAVGFTVTSIAQVRSGLLGLGAILAAVIGLLAYAAVGLEVYHRREEIGVLRSLGASPSAVAGVYEGQALVLALVGATLGSALGIVLAHGIVSFAPLLGLPNLVLLPVPWVPVGLGYAIALAACAIGGLVPARRAARLLRHAWEARPS